VITYSYWGWVLRHEESSWLMWCLHYPQVYPALLPCNIQGIFNGKTQIKVMDFTDETFLLLPNNDADLLLFMGTHKWHSHFIEEVWILFLMHSDSSQMTKVLLYYQQFLKWLLLSLTFKSLVHRLIEQCKCWYIFSLISNMLSWKVEEKQLRWRISTLNSWILKYYVSIPLRTWEKHTYSSSYYKWSS
jgi:hypothetical protein